MIALAQIPSLSSIYAPLSSGKISSSVIPSLSGTYALTGHNHSGVYAPAVHSHVPSDIGAVESSVDSADAGKVIKTNGDGKIDHSFLTEKGTIGLFVSATSEFFAFFSGMIPCSVGCDWSGTQTQPVLIVLEDGAQYIAKSLLAPIYAGYLEAPGNPIELRIGAASSSLRMCLYANSSCAGNCGYRKAARNALLFRYKSDNSLEWMKVSGTETAVSVGPSQTVSYRDGSNCVTTTTASGGTTSLYQFVTGYSVPSVITSNGGWPGGSDVYLDTIK